MKFGLLAALLAFCLALTNDGCKNGDRVRPCDQCTTVTPTYSILPAGLYVKPPELPDITGSILKVTRLADSTVIMFDTIEPGGFRIVPVNLDSTAINVRLDFLTSTPLPTRLNAPKYCPSSDDFLPRTTLGLIVMDVVLQNKPDLGTKGNTCNYTCGSSANLTQLTASSGIYTITIPYGDYNSGMLKYFTVGGLKFILEFLGDDNMNLYECLNGDWSTHYATPSDHKSPIICSNSSESFSISNHKTSGSTPDLIIEIDTGNMTSSGTASVCVPLAH